MGHVIPIAGVGATLVKRGHKVKMMASETFQAVIEQAGMTFIEVEQGRYPQKFMDRTLQECEEKLQHTHIDLVICDSALAPPAYWAEKHHIPWVSYQTSIFWPDQTMPGKTAFNHRMRTLYEKELNTLRQQHELPLLDHPFRTRGDGAGLSPYLHVLMCLPALFPANMELPPHSVIVGPCAYMPPHSSSHSLTNWKQKINESQHPHIVVCTSSAPKDGYREGMDRYIITAIDAFSHQPVQVTILEHEPPNISLPSNVHWVNDANPNHHHIFPFADIIITHGGLGTLQKAIQHHVPSVIIPLGEDHHLIAKQCESIGISSLLQLEQLTPFTLHAAVHHVWNQNKEMNHFKSLKVTSCEEGNEASANLMEQQCLQIKPRN